MSKFYAIGFKQYVELRQAIKKPVEEVTETMIKSDFSKTKFKLRVVHHIGGRVVKTMLGNKFTAVSGLYVGEGEMVEVPSAVAKRFL